MSIYFNFKLFIFFLYTKKSYIIAFDQNHIKNKD